RDLDHARELMQQALVSDVAWRLLQELAVGIGPRPAGSEGDRRAVAWAQGALRELGLQQVRTQAMELKVWQRGKGSAQLLGRSLSDASGPRQAGAPRELVMAALGNSISTPEGGVEAEVAWYPSLAALMEEPADPARSRANGRIVFIDSGGGRAARRRGLWIEVGGHIRRCCSAWRADRRSARCPAHCTHRRHPLRLSGTAHSRFCCFGARCRCDGRAGGPGRDPSHARSDGQPQ
ncbi:MAG: hypothetical protein EBV28_13695, partial [Betaproteobacteria bacterium]|nr:hypothetical protein [Betaproteobacteria bacterium]